MTWRMWAVVELDTSKLVVVTFTEEMALAQAIELSQDYNSIMNVIEVKVVPTGPIDPTMRDDTGFSPGERGNPE